MSLKWRARATWAACTTAFVAAVFIIGPDRIDQSGWLGAIVFLPIVIMVGAQLFAFHCPHCGARAVRGRAGYFLVSDECDRCFRDFEGPYLSEDQVAEKLVGERNPELARQMREERLEEEDLRRRAPTDPRAASSLEAMLRKRLNGVELWAREMRRLYDARQMKKKHVEDAEASLKRLKDDLAHLELLKAGTERSRLTRA
jgi:hypothetical protein